MLDEIQKSSLKNALANVVCGMAAILFRPHCVTSLVIGVMGIL